MLSEDRRAEVRRCSGSVRALLLLCPPSGVRETTSLHSLYKPRARGPFLPRTGGDGQGGLGLTSHWESQLSLSQEGGAGWCVTVGNLKCAEGEDLHRGNQQTLPSAPP